MSSRGTQGLTSHGQSPLSRRRWIKMPGYVTRFLELLVFLALPMTVRTITVPFYWNSSNPLLPTYHPSSSSSCVQLHSGHSLTWSKPHWARSLFRWSVHDFTERFALS
ncbi:hypothetical protein RRG08_014663 [Elysia crispata]|uniref:Uncharacterized protein n=1 Tax=Elysia crispata TaxID=231223 RepID=A0AAE0YIP4_9GAST|nr:hypothetical protein RRG08_014663 [Elysia crispata]